jgi:glycosyltransferase involved in cell wall biosynthesis
VRLLHVVATGQRRGAEIFAADLARALSGDGIDQRVAVLRGPEVAVDFPVPLTVLGDGRSRVPALRVDPRTLGALHQLFGAWRPDLIQVHGGEPLKHALLAARRPPIPVVYRRIGSAPQRITRGVGRLGHAQLMRRASRVVAVAEALRRETITTFRVPSRRVITIPNAVDAERLVPARSGEDVRAALGIPPKASVMISIGALTWEKDPEAHLAVSSLVCRRKPDAVHVFVGDGPLRPSLESRIRALGLTGAVRLLGVRDDVPDLLAAADVLVLASRVEGLPGCVIEAGMIGRPTLGYAVAGVPEVVEDGRSGILVSPGDVRGLADAVLQVLEGAELRASLGAAARDRCRSDFDIRRIAPRYRQLYEELAP